MVAGIIFAALGIKQTLAHVREPLGKIPAVALCAGVALYLLGHNAFRLREEGSVSVPRLVVAVLCLALRNWRAKASWVFPTYARARDPQPATVDGIRKLLSIG
jgi:low temperature requirement protein LtrA